jgi:catechol 2,3-dioxygenase-like lactoylglutathione lyase family enzyme
MKRMRRLILSVSLAAIWAGVPLKAQLSAPNDVGVAMGHLHLNVTNTEALNKFWLELGGVPTKLGTYDVMKFPGVFIMLNLHTVLLVCENNAVCELRASQTPAEPPTGGSVGSVVNHVGFKVPNVQESLAKWKAAGLKTVSGSNPQQFFLFTPDGLLRIEILEDKSLTVPIAFHHVHYWVDETGPGGADSVQEIKAWYVKMFGATPGMRGTNQADDLPGVNLTFSKSPTPTVGTKGRVLDHIGFEVKGLDAFCKSLEARGVKFDRPYARGSTGNVSALLTDPWGTSIELTEGLNRLQ